RFGRVVERQGRRESATRHAGHAQNGQNGHRETKAGGEKPKARQEEQNQNLAKHKEKPMSNVRLLVGTKKGAFILTSDGQRRNWDVSGPHFAGWEIYHLKGSPVDPNRIYASQTSGWFGQIIQRSDDGGKTWHQPGTPPGETTTPDGAPKGESNKFVYDTSAETGAPKTTHQFSEGK